MPEGPEVRKNIDFLKNYENRLITDVQIISGRYTKKPIVGLESFLSEVASKKVILKEVSCKGKFIYMNFDNGMTLFSTLGMSGVWSPIESKHARVVFALPFKNLKGELVVDTVYFTDIRNFFYYFKWNSIVCNDKNLFMLFKQRNKIFFRNSILANYNPVLIFSLSC